MSTVSPPGLTMPGVTHHRLDGDDVQLHFVSAGDTGTPILLVHGWPETWWAFRGLLPLLAASHRVFAVDLRGFGASAAVGEEADYTEAAFAEDLHRLVEHLGVGPVHLLAQDISGGLAFTFAATHPDEVLSYIGIETALAGFGLEMLADVVNGGSWHLGFLGASGIPQMLLPGHERDMLGWAYSVMGATEESVRPEDFEEFVRSYTGPAAWDGTSGLYRSLFTDGGRTKELVDRAPLTVPVLAIDGPNHPFTEMSLRNIAAGRFESARIEGVGHLVAQEAPGPLSVAVLDFVTRVDAP